MGTCHRVPRRNWAPWLHWRKHDEDVATHWLINGDARANVNHVSFEFVVIHRSERIESSVSFRFGVSFAKVVTGPDPQEAQADREAEGRVGEEPPGQDALTKGGIEYGQIAVRRWHGISERI